VKTIGFRICINIFYIGAQVEFKMASKHIFQTIFKILK
jgi:hypothetical protein